MDGTFRPAYRLRRPLDSGSGVDVVVARDVRNRRSTWDFASDTGTASTVTSPLSQTHRTLGFPPPQDQRHSTPQSRSLLTRHQIVDAVRVGLAQGVAALEPEEEPLGRVSQRGRRSQGGRRRSRADAGAAGVGGADPQGRPGVGAEPGRPVGAPAGRRVDRAGHRVSQETVAKPPRAQGFSLQANAKTVEGGQHPDRYVQFYRR